MGIPPDVGISRSGKNFAGDKNVRIFSIAELQDAPKLARGVIRHGMRGGIPQDEHDSFVLLYQDEDARKKLADFSDTNDAYVLLVDTTATIRWRAHGKAPDKQAIDALRKEISRVSP